MRAQVLALLMLSTSSAAYANCIGIQALSADEIAKFKSNPAVYMAGTTDAELENLSQRLAASDSSTLDGLKKAIAEKPLPQQTAISVGLARAAQSCAAVDPTQARDIQLVVVDLSPVLREAFERTTRQRAVATTGAGSGASSAGSAGGPTDLSETAARNQGSSDPTEWSTANGPTVNAFSGSSGTAFLAGNDSSSSSIIFVPVSP